MSRTLIIALLSIVALALIVLMVASIASIGNISPFSFSIRGNVEATKTLTDRFPMQSGQQLEIINSLGPIEIRGQGSELVVTATIKAYGASSSQAQRALQDIELIIEPTSSGYRIVGILPERTVNIGRSDTIGLEITVPDGVDTTVSADLGKVTVANYSGDLDINASLGKVNIGSFVGNVNVDASLGQITVDRAEITDSGRLHSNLGEIVFKGYPGSHLSLSSDLGSIDVTLPDDIAVNIEARVNLGSISNNLPFDGKDQDSRMSGVIGTGTPEGMITIDASLGSISIKGGYN